ncbi:MAG: hypothetical protein PUJ79_02655 [Helicobacter sp.]|nr:hypothetical protein [Helicobacter sp.]MDY5740377.1 hypothetical protein [Helicobacter sp.]
MLKRLLVLPLLALESLGVSEHASIGIGGFYSNSSATNISMQYYGIHLNLHTDLISQNHKIKFSAEYDRDSGSGKRKLSNSQFAYLEKFGSGKNFRYSHILIRFGFNLASKETPLFLNLIGGFGEVTNSHKETDLLKKTTWNAGVELEGALPLGQSYKLTYSAGYMPTGIYYSFIDPSRGDKGMSARSYVSKLGHTVLVSVGFTQAINERLYFYTKLKGQYKVFGESQPVALNIADTATAITNTNYPASRDVSAMLEVGIGF